MGTNSYVAKLKARIDQAITQRDHWKHLAENRNSIVVTEVCPESRSVEEYIIDADSVRASWRLIRGYREQIEALRVENERLQTDYTEACDDAMAVARKLRAAEVELAALKAVPVRVEVVAWMKHELCTRLYFHAPPEPSIPLMTVAQHNAIVAALSAPAAGPDVSPLVEALELMVTTHDEGGWPTATITIARAALAANKAGGIHD